LCEILNAEIVAGTINSVSDCLGYMTWTFFARRVRANPSYYGAKSRNEDDVNNFLLAVAEQALSELRQSGCIQLPTQEDDSQVVSTALGRACSAYYLSHQTPKQMLLGLNETLRTFSNCLNVVSPVQANSTIKSRYIHFERDSMTDNCTISWLLYLVCSTQEFDEHPVRHNEEILNENLSKLLKWGPQPPGPDTDRPLKVNKEIFKDPHTKCFLLVQAYIEKIKLPIVDYENDTKMIVENLPRLLAAVEFIAGEEMSSGCFDILTQLCRTRQALTTRLPIEYDPLFQIPGFQYDDTQRTLTKAKATVGSTMQIHLLRALSREDATIKLQNVFRDQKSMPPIPKVVDALFDYPFIVDVQISAMELDRRAKQQMGSLTLTIEVDVPNARHRKTYFSAGESFTLTLLLGTATKGLLLAKSNVRLTTTGKRTINRKLTFDVSRVTGHSNDIVLRVMFNEVRGLDVEMFVHYETNKT
jgi:Sec63 Brl domain